jgi:hypothetical protein
MKAACSTETLIISTGLLGVTSQKTAVFIVIAVKWKPQISLSVIRSCAVI